MVAHNIPYVAQASASNPTDFMRKVARGLEIEGPAFINVLTPCHRGWRCKPDESIEAARLAVETRFWPLYEVDHGRWKINHRPKVYVPVIEWFKIQGRFKHLLADDKNGILAWHQEQVNQAWEALLRRAEG
jgi:pyruvate ferredoxin oxidoreductase beta subunit